MNSPSSRRVFHRFRRTVLASGAVALLALLFLPAASSRAATAPERVVAVGDVHGDYDAFVGILQQAGLIDSQRRWIGGQATLVQTGDILDRGPKSRQAMDLLMALEKQAQKKGGRAIVLLGNHEVMNLTGDLRYVSPEEYASYADRKSDARRKAAYRIYLDFRQSRTPPGQSPPATPELEKSWMEAHPLGFLEHREAFAPTGKYGKWLREHAAVVKLDDLVFLHGGLNPTLASWSVQAINSRIRDELNAFDATREYLLKRKLILPFFTLEEMTAPAQAEWQARQEARARRAAAAPAGAAESPEEERENQLLQAFLGLGSWLIFAPDGPLWFRGFAQWSEEEGAAQLPKLLASLGARGFVVGHTPQADGRIHTSFGGRVFLIDTGMLSRAFTGGRPSALEIRSGTITAIYPGERTVLLDPSRTASPAGDEAAPVEAEPAANSGGQAQPAEPVPAPRRWTGPDGKLLPFTSDEQVLEFLRTAKMKRMRELGEGITKPKKVLLEKDGIQMNAVFRDINASKPVMTFASGRTELQFRDSYLFEPAAFELSRLLGLDNVPLTTLRRLEGKSGSIQVWIENAMTEGRRKEEKIAPPDNDAWNHQMYVLHVFDALVYNTDRNLGNVLIDPDWKVWMIDHTRAFRRFPTLENAAVLNHCEAGLLEKLRTLDEQTVRQRLKKYLSAAEINALLKRRQQLVEHFQKLIQERGEEKVLYRLQ